MNYFIQTFGCQANKADSELITSVLAALGYRPTLRIEKANVIILNTCSVRQSAEDRVYARMEILRKLKAENPDLKIIVAGCMVGPSGDKPRDIHIAKRLNGVDKFIGTQDYPKLAALFKELLPAPSEYLPSLVQVKRINKKHAYILISSGCNNFCTFCVVPFARGREVSRPFSKVVTEAIDLVKRGRKKITLLGQNVNSYGSDLVKSRKYELPNGQTVEPVYVKRLGRYRIPTLFPFLLEAIANIPGVELVDFISSNPWDFSDELIEVIARNPTITRVIHIPIQAGNNEVLKRMNRWYSKEEYASLISKIRKNVPQVAFSTDIIVGFPGETEKQFLDTVLMVKKIGWKAAYIAEYSPRSGTMAAQKFVDDVPSWEKKRRFRVLDELINGYTHPPVKVPLRYQTQSVSL